MLSPGGRHIGVNGPRLPKASRPFPRDSDRTQRKGETGAKCSTWNICGARHGVLKGICEETDRELDSAGRATRLVCFPTLADARFLGQGEALTSQEWASRGTGPRMFHVEHSVCNDRADPSARYPTCAWGRMCPTLGCHCLKAGIWAPGARELVLRKEEECSTWNMGLLPTRELALRFRIILGWAC